MINTTRLPPGPVDEFRESIRLYSLQKEVE